MAATSAARADPNGKPIPSPDHPHFLTFGFIMVIIIFFVFPRLRLCLLALCLFVCLFVSFRFSLAFLAFPPCACLAKVLINFHIFHREEVSERGAGAKRSGALSEREISLLASETLTGSSVC